MFFLLLEGEGEMATLACEFFLFTQPHSKRSMPTYIYNISLFSLYSCATCRRWTRYRRRRTRPSSSRCRWTSYHTSSPERRTTEEKKMKQKKEDTIFPGLRENVRIANISSSRRIGSVIPSLRYSWQSIFDFGKLQTCQKSRRIGCVIPRCKLQTYNEVSRNATYPSTFLTYM